ncbi:ras-related protein Rab-34-like [Mytilus galloprovincialis]|uniref:Ras-related protein Rab-36 n=1 Tax=Mytilus galloprovincialis TaxID=29158 RepID=A0A8B6FAE0_MYTGA|nr:Ras-related protein Rab-34 [Mytilus galloprovincialis]
MSAARTMMSQNVAKDRIVTKFPQAFHPDATPYQKMNFHPKVKAACTDNKTGRVGLKICKAVLVGDVSVGKTSLVNRFCHDVFDRDYKATIGVDFEVEKFSLLNVPFTLQIWDTAGQERFKCIAASYYRGANVTIVVFDLSDESSLANVARWMDDAAGNSSDPIKFVVGTKKDLVSPAAFESIEQNAVEIANSLGAEFWAVSSKTGENVKEFFFRAVALTFEAAILREIDTSSDGPTKQIGNDLIKVDNENVFERRSKKNPLGKCCDM